MGLPEYILIGVGAVIITLLSVIFIRTAVFRPKATRYPEAEAVDVDRDAESARLQALIRCKTVSCSNPDEEDDGEFRKLLELLPKLYPAVFRECEYLELSDRALLFTWRGAEHDSPTVLMAHYDVVPADGEAWEKPPFDGVIENGIIWGRGTLDTKVTFGSILSAANSLIERGFSPKNDIYLAFSGGEEINGRGASNIVRYLKENNITPAMVLDEGGAVVAGAFPGLRAPCALIGSGEKGILNLEYKVKSQGGHASAPIGSTAVGILSKACVRVEKKPFKSKMTPPVREMFDTLGRHTTLPYRMIFANLWLFGGILGIIARKRGGELNALLRTTVAFTQMEGSSAANVLPTEATMVSNIRLRPKDSIEGAVKKIKAAVKDERIEITPLYGTEPSPASPTDTEGYRVLSEAVKKTWPEAIVSPYLMIQCSDSRHFCNICPNVYRFSAIDLTDEERKTIHGHNERIRIDALSRCVEFYLRLISSL